MGLNSYLLGDLITQRREKNPGIDAPSKGVSSDGFINPKQPDADTHLYNVFYRGDFVFNPARMELNSIALNRDYEVGICSSLYEIFYVNNTEILLPEYLNLFIKRDEFARLCKYIGWGSAREYCRVSSLSDITMQLPPIDIQRKYAAIYESMLANQRSYEQGLNDLKLSCDIMLDRCKRTEARICLGGVFAEVDRRNEDLACRDAYGLNIEKRFMLSKASSNDLRKYKLVGPGQFAYSSMQTGREKCIRIALNNEGHVLAVSPAYTVLEVVNPGVEPKFVMMWLSRAEVDRLGWFCSDGSIRANLDLDRFYEIEIPQPDMRIQRSLVALYDALSLRARINGRLKAQLKDICPVLIRGSIEEALR